MNRQIDKLLVLQIYRNHKPLYYHINNVICFVSMRMHSRTMNDMREWGNSAITANVL